MGDNWIQYLQETIEGSVEAILDGNRFDYLSNGGKHTDLFIIFNLFQYGKKKAALQLADELGSDWLSPDEIKFLGLLMVKQQEYDRALAFLKYTVTDSSEKEIEVLEGLLYCFMYQNTKQKEETGPESAENPSLQWDLLDILHEYQADFEKWTIKEKESRLIYRFLAQYHVWSAGNIDLAIEYCEKWLNHGDTGVYKLLWDIATIAHNPVYAIKAYEKALKSGDVSCFLDIANSMEELQEFKKQEIYIHKAVKHNISGARKKLFDYYMIHGDSLSYAWEQFQYLIEVEHYTATQEELDSMQSYQQDLLRKAISEENMEEILSAYYSLGMYCSHSGYQVAYWQQIYTIIYSDHHHLDTLSRYLEKNWEDQVSTDGDDAKIILYKMLLAEMDLFRNLCNDRWEFEYVNYQIFWEICEFFNDRENAAWYYSLYLQSNPGLPRTETLYQERYIKNQWDITYTQGMLYKN